MHRKKKNVYEQTQALLCKNLLKKWRMKRESLLEWGFPVLLVLYMGLFSYTKENIQLPGKPSQNLGRVDKYNSSLMIAGYTPISNITKQIMNKTGSAPFLRETKVIGAPNQKSLDELLVNNFPNAVGIIFSDTFSYKLKFFHRSGIPFLKEEYFSAHCWYGGNEPCSLAKYWRSGFVTLQTAINAAIIEILTDHSVMEELMSVTAINMKTLPFIAKGFLQNEMFIFYCLLYFSSFIYFASFGVTKERKKSKDLMKMMGLQDSAFWFSWGLIYAGFIFIISIFIAMIITSTKMIVMTGFMVIFILFFLYGLSLIALTFLMSVVIKKTALTSFVVLLFTLFWGGVGLSVLHRQLPSSLEWILSIFSPFAFTAGMAQIIHMDFNMTGVTFPDPSGDSYKMIATFFMLAFDAFWYYVLALYLDKILPYGNERRYSPLFFLNSSSCFQHQRTDKIIDKETDLEHTSDDFEPIAPEFQGKEAIRIRNVTKEYKGKPDKIEALKDLAFDIYEGQITAVLGHSGAGKTTLLNILSGLSIPTQGSVTIYSNKLSEMADLENISKLTGVCPQFNVQFDYLTVRENLRLFAKIKGIPPQEVEQEIQRVVLELQMDNIEDIIAQNLSGGQKRKLTFGIAILGDPQIFLLDEPTAGLDPFSRHQVWSLLKERKMGRVIVFSTQFMDEADILADRKVFLSKGKLKCAGSSLFLKKKWGIGYHLSLQLNGMCVQEKITSIVKKHIPEAKLSAKSEGKLVYTLPLERTNKFPELYENLDRYPDLGIENYGVSMTTLNEVFLKLEGKSTIDEPGFATSGEVQAEGAGDTERFVEMEQVLSSLSEMKETVGGMALWGQQIRAIARVRFLKLKHERKSLLSLLLILGIGIFPMLWEYINVKTYGGTYTWEISPHLYFLAPGQPPHDPFTQLLIINNTGASIDDFIHSVERQNIALEVDASGNRSGLDDPSYNGAIIVSGHNKNYNFSLACNTKRLNCFPVLIDIVSNGLLRMAKSSAHIQTGRRTSFKEMDRPVLFMMPSIFWLLMSSGCAPYIAMSSINDYTNKVWSQLRISGLFPSAYWLGQALVDVPLYWLLFLLMYSLDMMLSPRDPIFQFASEIVHIPCAIGSATSLIFFTYVISFIFRKGRKNSDIWSFIYFVITFLSVAISLVELPQYHLVFLINFLVPQTILISCMFLSFYLFMFSSFEGEPFLIYLIPLLQLIFLIFILRCLEWKFEKISMRKDPLFRISPRSSDVHQNPEEPDGEDEDVHMERVRTANALNSTNFDEKPAIIASCLRKEYTVKRKLCFSKKKKKIATRNVSFCVRKGEVLGLLGHNGAGKSTSIKVITGDTKLTAGQVLLRGSSEGDPLEYLGYCPQENALWPNLTVREHLEVFAAVKGLRKADAKVTITRLVEALKLQEELKCPVKALPEGIKRKLCFMLSILGNPPVVLLDEPSTGMDPKGQQQMWQAIRASFNHTERGALLTTHYMAEAEALCDRVAIMVAGRLRCIGSIQHLKSKFGKDYLLEMKVKTLAHMEPLHSEILRLFPQAARQERYSSLMVYKLPVEDVRPLAQAFFKLEKVKQSFDLEDYSLSQSTLEQVFLELSKEQELENFDDELQSSMKRKLLSQEEP
ncbi:ATP-binding cassette sub-family A member 9 isoform X5 [Pipistrellus kuhlii]|uniref:ATP-binding cassette sub-family A member 9 isoform X5 n=1 Tax=Pipistrellus kuhlii TaxID=59472 RepID=UPI001E271D1A|nr:ATP-binding cassette sub-family A member 9 isoform X5 [Pipistrellus kuhlii]